MIFPKNLNNFNNQLKAEEYKKFISKLIELKFIHIPAECNKCHENNIHIQNLNNSLNTKICFRCMNKECKNIISIRRNSFFERHPKIPLKYLFDIIKCFTLYNFNAEETLNYIYDEDKKIIMKDTILSIFSELRQEIRKYYYHKYMTESFVEEGKMNFTDFSIISVDEAIFAIEKVKESNKYIKEDIKQENEEEKAQKEAADKKNSQNSKNEKDDEKEEENGDENDNRRDRIDDNRNSYRNNIRNNRRANRSDDEEDLDKESEENAEKRELNAREKKALNEMEKRLKKEEDEEYSSDNEQDENRSRNERFKNIEQQKILEMEREKHKFGDEYDENYDELNEEIDENLKENIKRAELKNKYKMCSDGKIRPNYRLRPFWVLGMINTVTQDFRVMLIPDRSMLTLKTYLTHFIKEYNEIITDGYRGYSFLDADILKLKIDIILDSLRNRRITKDDIMELNQLKSALLNLRNYYCYTGRKYLHRSYNHSKFEFGRGIESSSHIEGLWGNLKSLIKGIYHQIPIANLNLFLKEAEWKFKMRGFSHKQKLEFLAKIINFNLPSFESKEKDLLREKEEELPKELIKTEQPKPISKRIYNLLEKYRIFKYNLDNPDNKKLKEGKFLLKGNNAELGPYLGKQNEMTLAQKREIHRKIMEERKQKNSNLGIKNHLNSHQNLLDERLNQDDDEEEEIEIDDAEIQNKRKKLITKINKKLKDVGGNKFIDDFFKNEKQKSDEKMRNENNVQNNQRSNVNPLHIQAQNNLLEQKRKREEEKKKKEEKKEKQEMNKNNNNRVLHRKPPKKNEGNYDLKQMLNKK